MKKLILLDLDGTLTNTADEYFKPMKDGLIETDVSKIPVFNGAVEFVSTLQREYIVVLVSDSHPRYVNKIATEIFGFNNQNYKSVLSLADKPNQNKTISFLSELNNVLGNECPNINNRDQKLAVFVIGDTWLDIELGRSLNCFTILTKFYTATRRETRDAIGNDWKHLKSGPTFVVSTYERIKEILSDPIGNLLASEGIFYNRNTNRARKFRTDINNGVYTLYRSLSRQNAGECDPFAVANYYFEFQRPDRTEKTLKLLAKSLENYLAHVISQSEDFSWDYLTYVSDKKTTIPQNKMSQLIDLCGSDIPKVKLFGWDESTSGSIRHQKKFEDRKSFVVKNLTISENFSLLGKNIVVVDDQFTTGATADAVTSKLRSKGANHVLFLTLFYLITNVESESLCPKCQKKMAVKIRRSDGNKFLSCTPQKYGGDGCGHAQNLMQ